MACPNCGSNRIKEHNPRGQASKSSLGRKCKDCGETFTSGTSTKGHPR